MARVANKVAIVTGAGTGVGRACMTLLAAEGAHLPEDQATTLALSS